MTPNERSIVYKEFLLNAAPRLLSELDRDPTSITFGSFDREYWAWATKDFSNIDLQRAIYPLALLLVNNFEGNVYFMQEKLREWIFAAVKFWINSQHKDGSFDHHYPNEYSYVGVAFTLYEIAEAYRTMADLNLEIPDDLHDRWLHSMNLAASFLLKNEEKHAFISNHRAGAACALCSMFLITGNKKFSKKSFQIIRKIQSMQSKEGWYSEYSGADPGYQTLDTYYQANFYRLSEDKDTLKSIEASLKFLIYFFHPDGSVGGEYGSRNCPLYFPSGFEFLSPLIPEAEAITDLAIYAVKGDGTPTLLGMDIRNFVPMLSSYAQAFLLSSKNGDSSHKKASLPFEEEFEIYWPESQLYVRSEQGLYSITSFSKGGVIKVFDIDKKELIASHCGYEGESDRVSFSSQMLNHADINASLFAHCSNRKNAPVKKISLNFSTPFFVLNKKKIMTPSRFLLFRIFNLTVGKLRLINDLMRKYIIVWIFIYRKSEFPLRLHREFVFGNGDIEIFDTIELKSKSINIRRLSFVDIFTTIYMGSSKYFRQHELFSTVEGSGFSIEMVKGKDMKISFKINKEKGLSFSSD